MWWCATRGSIPTRGGKSASLSGIILAATALVLLIACANVASLLLSRATTRGPELAVRLALGANRVHLVRQLLTESLIISIGGGALGVLFSLWTVGALPSFFPPEQAQMLDARVDQRVFAFTFAIAFASGVLFGLVPAFQTRRPNVIAGLRGESGGPQAARAGTRVRNAMVVVQVALSSVLVVSTGLLARSLANAWRADLGYGARNVVVATTDVPPHELEAAAIAPYFRAGQRGSATAARRRSGRPHPDAAARPGQAGAVSDSPAIVPAAGEGMEININVASATYFETMRVPLVAGRVFDSRDRMDGPRVIVVNDVLADRYYRGAAVGKQAIDSRDIAFEIVGVVPHRTIPQPAGSPASHRLLPAGTGTRGADDPRRTHLQRPGSSRRDDHGSDAPGSVERARLSVNDARKIHVEALTVERLATALVGSCSAMALLLAMVGVYGVMAFAVALRAREIGVRLALGARPLQIVRLVFAEGFRVISIGLAIGLAAAVALPGLLGFFLHDMSGHDGLSLAAAPSILALVAAIAAIAPVRRALGVDPMIVLRYQ